MLFLIGILVLKYIIIIIINVVKISVSKILIFIINYTRIYAPISSAFIIHQIINSPSCYKTKRGRKKKIEISP